MKIDKFDQLSEKLLKKLNEDYALCEENDGMVNTKDNGQEVNVEDTLRSKRDKETAEKQKAFKDSKDIPSPTTKIMHDKNVVEEKEADAKLSKFRFAKKLAATTMQEAAIITDEELDEYDYHDLAEEFDGDLEEANQQMLNNAKQLETIEKNKAAQQKEAFDKQHDDISTQQTEMAENQSEEKEKAEDDLREKQTAETKKLQQAEQDLTDKQKKQEEENERKMKKIQDMKAAAKNDNTAGGGSQMFGEEYDNNVKLFKEEQAKHEALEEGIKQWWAEHKKKQLGKKLDKKQQKFGKLKLKLEKFSKRYKISDENLDNYESSQSGMSQEKAYKIKMQYIKLRNAATEYHDSEVVPTDRKLIKAEHNADKMSNEEAEIDRWCDYVDVLCEEVDAMFRNDANYEELNEEILEERKKPKKIQSAATVDGEKIPGSIDFGDGTQYVPPESKVPSTAVAHDSMEAKINRMIADARADGDDEKVKQLEQKLREYKSKD